MELRRTFAHSTLAAAVMFAFALPAAANDQASSAARNDTPSASSTSTYGANPSGPATGSASNDAMDSQRQGMGTQQPDATGNQRQDAMDNQHRDAVASNSQVVRDVQEKLKSEGHDPGQVDGIVGPQTREALKKFQQARGIDATGDLDDRTLNALGVDAMPGGAS